MPFFSLFKLTTTFMVYVSSLRYSMVWDKGKLLSVLPSLVVEQILLVLISSVGPNILRWHLSEDQNFSLMNA